MTRHNKKYYQSEQKERRAIVLTGRVFLMYRDEEIIAEAVKGDVLLHPSVEALHTIRQGQYDITGHAGYFRVDVCDGKAWQPVLLTDLFPENEHHFSKKERPMDTAALCTELLAQLKNRSVVRTYREHYELEAEEEIPNPLP